MRGAKSLESTEPRPANGGNLLSNATYPCYWMRQDITGNWFWIYFSRNRDEIARSSECFERRADCERSIKLIKDSASGPVYCSE